MDCTVLGYTAAYRDAGSGGYPLGNGYRVLAPALMRFAAPDSWSPFGRGGINPYTYCAGDPVNRADPSGHMMEWMGLFQGLADEAAASGSRIDRAAGASLAISAKRASAAGEESGLGLTLDLSEPAWQAQMRSDGVLHVHGSNSDSFEGVVKFGGLLPMNRIMENAGWFFRDRDHLPSGEFGYTLDALKKNRVDAQGVSVYGFHKADLSVRFYASQGLTERNFPVLYAFGHLDTVPFGEHAVSEGTIGVGQIRRVYVPMAQVGAAKRLLSHYGSPELSGRVSGSTIFDDLAASAPAWRGTSRSAFS